MADLGSIIKNKRTEFKMQQKELAEKINKSPQLICDIEAGRRNPSVNTLFDIAKVLNISLDKFF